MKNAILSIIRHLLTFGGGLVVANNPGISVETADSVIGAATALTGLLWGAFDEYRAEKATRKAAAGRD